MKHVYFGSAEQGWQLTGRVHDLAIPLMFDGPQPNYYGAAAASVQPMRSGEFVGDTRQGGSCNADLVRLNPHCNGTHTECVGHLTGERVFINDFAPALPLLALVISLTPSPCGDTGENCIDHAGMTAALKVLPTTGATALIIRTLPNSDSKLTKAYTSAQDSPYFTPTAIDCVVAAGIEHILVDTPSLDKYYDGGRLGAHRTFFGLPDFDQRPRVSLKDASRAYATVTEMIFVPDDVADGLYLLNLQVPAFCLDAAPSRPLLYELETP